jgi:hypothetical protein
VFDFQAGWVLARGKYEMMIIPNEDNNNDNKTIFAVAMQLFFMTMYEIISILLF